MHLNGCDEAGAWGEAQALLGEGESTAWGDVFVHRVVGVLVGIGIGAVANVDREARAGVRLEGHRPLGGGWLMLEVEPLGTVGGHADAA